MHVHKNIVMDVIGVFLCTFPYITDTLLRPKQKQFTKSIKQNQ